MRHGKGDRERRGESEGGERERQTDRYRVRVKQIEDRAIEIYRERQKDRQT